MIYSRKIAKKQQTLFQKVISDKSGDRRRSVLKALGEMVAEKPKYGTTMELAFHLRCCSCVNLLANGGIGAFEDIIATVPDNADYGKLRHVDCPPVEHNYQASWGQILHNPNILGKMLLMRDDPNNDFAVLNKDVKGVIAKYVMG